tara:strand:- start:663 stop:785 length:123 start_codon:yes stop_codon:yes gene_type:complete
MIYSVPKAKVQVKITAHCGECFPPAQKVAAKYQNQKRGDK